MRKMALVFVSMMLVLSVLINAYSEQKQPDINITYDDSYIEYSKDRERNYNLKFPLDCVAFDYDYIMAQIDKVEDKEACLKAVMTVLYVMNTLQLYGSDDITLLDIYDCLNSISLDCSYYNVKYEVLELSDYIEIYSVDPFLENKLRVGDNEGFVIYFDFVFDTFTTLRLDIPIC